MKGKALSLLTLLLAAPLSSYAAEQLVPAGSLIGCTVSEPKLSSKTTAVGDPVLCKVSFTERYGRSQMPYDSYLEGRFEDYKDPGHFIGKGWMELKFDRMIIEPDTVIPFNAKVVDVPGYNVDRYGRILGKGHAVRDTVTWMIPVLWPIDLINLPRRGPRPTLREETRLTLKVMDDLAIPMIDQQPLQQEPSGLYKRPSAYEEQPPPPPPATVADYTPAPQPAYVAPPQQPVYLAPPPAYYYPPRPMIAMVPRSVIVYRNGYAYRVVIP